jgi:hypothetical protein
MAAILLSCVLVWLKLRLAGRSYGDWIPDHRRIGDVFFTVVPIAFLMGLGVYIHAGGIFNNTLIPLW